jgi:UDP-N-acetyl-D-mannosaminuronic acid dehydrogenase
VTEKTGSSDAAFAHDVSVIGLGRIGLPLALAFADRSLRVLGVEKDTERLGSIRRGEMPFREAGTQDILDRVGGTEAFQLSDRPLDAAQAEFIVFTLGTPALAQIEIDISQIRDALDGLLPSLRPGHTIVLRSTIAPGTTEFVAGYIEQQRGLRAGEEIFVAHVPERIAAHHFLEEIDSLPHIVGGVGEESGRRAAELFSRFRSPIEQTTPVQAELAKIWTNIYRYANFALPNLLMMDCEQYGANVFDVIDLINRDYPRGGMARPGLSAGTCLRKDFAFSEERSNAPGMLLAVSRVNESVPNFLVNGMRRRLGDLRDRTVAVLGLTFKGDSDDLRDSLSAKLVRLLERELAVVRTHDPMIPEAPPSDAPAFTTDLGSVLDGADIVVCATNHSEYSSPEALALIRERTAEGCLLVDPWNAFGVGDVFSAAGWLGSGPREPLPAAETAAS